MLLLAGITVGRFDTVRGVFNITDVGSVARFNGFVSAFPSFPTKMLLTVNEVDQDGFSNDIRSRLSVELALIEIPESEWRCDDDALAISISLIMEFRDAFSLVRRVFSTFFPHLDFIPL